MDQNGHGTFVAGVVGAVGNNALGVTGINQVRSFGKILRAPETPQNTLWWRLLSTKYLEIDC